MPHLCNHLKAIRIPKNVEHIESYAFYRNQLESLKLESKKLSLENVGHVFTLNQLTSVNIPSGVKVDTYVFDKWVKINYVP